MTENLFIIFPAIDLRGGKVVRLAQGDPGRQTNYGDNPLAWAERWKSEGAAWLHVVNLDGAFGEAASQNLKALESIRSLGLKIEFGGGLRDRSSIQRVLDLGVERICLGTAAIQDPPLVDWAIAGFGPQRIVADLGSRGGEVMIKGWQETTSMTVLEAGQRFRQQGLEWCVLTEVGRDGTGSGIDLDGALNLQSATGLKVVASGGVSHLEEVCSAKKAGLAGIIIGRALYEGYFSLSECWQKDYNDYAQAIGFTTPRPD